MEAESGKQWDDVEEKIEGRMVCACGSGEYDGVKKKDTAFGEFIEFLRFYKVQMNRLDVWRDALIIPEAFGLGVC